MTTSPALHVAHGTGLSGVERAARAMSKSNHGSEDLWKDYVRLVRIAIETLSLSQDCKCRTAATRAGLDRGVTWWPRFAEKIREVDAGCWEWTGNLEQGYGRFWLNRRLHRAHRLSYEALVGPIPDGLQIDHLCRNRACVNPKHLEPVVQILNVHRGMVGVENAQLGFCLHGHPASAYEGPPGKRRCGTCNREKNREYSAARKAKRA